MFDMVVNQTMGEIDDKDLSTMLVDTKKLVVEYNTHVYPNDRAVDLSPELDLYLKMWKYIALINYEVKLRKMLYGKCICSRLKYEVKI